MSFPEPDEFVTDGASDIGRVQGVAIPGDSLDRAPAGADVGVGVGLAGALAWLLLDSR